MWELYNVGRRLQPGEQPRREEPRQAQGTAGGLRERSRCATTSCRSTTAAPSASTPPSPAGPTCWMAARSLTVYPGMIGMMENAFINVKGVHHTITAEVELQGRQDQRRHHRPGRLLRRLGALHEGRQAAPRIQLLRPRAHQHRRRHRARSPGKHTIRYEFIPDEKKPGTGGKSILSVDGKKVAEGQIPKTQPFAFSARRRRRRRPRRRDERLHRLQARSAQRLHRQDRQGDGGAKITMR